MEPHSKSLFLPAQTLPHVRHESESLIRRNRYAGLHVHIIADAVALRTLKALISKAGYDVACFESGTQFPECLNSADFKQPIAHSNKERCYHHSLNA